MVEQEAKLEQYKNWVSSYLGGLSSQGRVSFLCYLMSIREFDEFDPGEMEKKFEFKHEKSDNSVLSRMRIGRFRKSIGIGSSMSDMSQEEKQFVNAQKNTILYPLLQTAVGDLKSSSMEEEINTIRSNNRGLERKLRKLKGISRARSKIRLKIKNSLSAVNWLYLGVFVLLCVFIAYIVSIGWAQKPTVSVELNVGEIIGGTLVGTGAMLAGGAYAARTLGGPDNPSQG